jgi:SNF2 family DNA or RNA helicase
MRRSDRQRELLEAANWDLIVLDEAHHARRKGAGTLQEKEPNALLDLMRKLKDRCQSLLLLTATPMQVHPVALWDLIDLLGLPAEWRFDDHVFLKYFQQATENPSPEAMEYLAGQFRATEAAFGELTEEELGRILAGASSLKRKKVLRVGEYLPTHVYADTFREFGLEVDYSRSFFLTALGPMWMVQARKSVP